MRVKAALTFRGSYRPNAANTKIFDDSAFYEIDISFGATRRQPARDGASLFIRGDSMLIQA